METTNTKTAEEKCLSITSEVERLTKELAETKEGNGVIRGMADSKIIVTPDHSFNIQIPLILVTSITTFD